MHGRDRGAGERLQEGLTHAFIPSAEEAAQSMCVRVYLCLLQDKALAYFCGNKDYTSVKFQVCFLPRSKLIKLTVV